MFRIEFKGKILPGFDHQIVRLEVAVRLRLREPQVARLFSGQTVILKKQVHAENSAAYLNELRSMGLDAYLVPLVRTEDGVASAYKAVFWGRILEGFDRTAVMTSAVRKFKVSPSQLKQIFSGVKVVLKRNLSAENGRLLVAELAAIGMQLELEPEELLPVAAATVAPVEPPAPEAAEDTAFSALLNTACDLSGTPLAGYDTSSDFARDDGDPGPAPVVQSPVLGKSRTRDGFDAANQDGFLNCPHCGQYQQTAETCRSCGGIMPPQRKLYVGKAGAFFDNSPTTLVTPAQARAKQLAPAEQRELVSSLREQLQGQKHAPAEQASRRGIGRFAWCLVLLAVVLAIVLYGLSRA